MVSISTTQNKWDSIIPLDKLWEQYERTVKPNGAIVLFGNQPFVSDLICSNKKLFRYNLVWDKRLSVGFLNANRMPLRRHEEIIVFYKKLPTYNPQKSKGQPYYKGKGALTDNYGSYECLEVNNKSGDRFPTSIIEISNANRHKNGHPTQKPVALGEYLIRTYTNPGDLVLDNCAGSGSFLVAAKNTGRNYIGIELSEEYCGIARERLLVCP